ncbi:TetR/AcrR family transcriptional regulator [Conexibacter arvalis]|uniref:AcrR family transcriptional regulator n=1 Tax=Conexibacter arvalis TaxID=912552 RepID=A0A840I8Q8_9ACTN|nr:TetR/AcrR family transcriptional regulator [Conexibacter arvalis]MBB4660633.1 AcrR family transcriptional regulator [Conexibacter arvalis]
MSTSETGVRARTRQAIVAAAIDVLAADGGASLADVASAAGVSRTTVHRYFPERSDLLAAVVEEAMARVETATERARLAEGPAPAALERACREYFELGSALTLLFGGSIEIADADWERCATSPEDDIGAVVARGHADGTIDPELTGAWVENLVWALLYSAWSHQREHDVPRQTSLDLCLRSLRKAIAA